MPPDEIVVTEEYRFILDTLSAGHPLVFVSGKAGTGKSTLIRWLVNQGKWQTAIVAPTGIAALNVGGSTIHSFFRLPPRLIERADIRRFNSAVYRNLRLLIIDEISMVRADLMDAVGWFLEKNGPRPEEPFGGVQLLLVGDLFQLPPVVRSGDLEEFFRSAYESPYFFSASVLRDVPMASVDLNRVFRQKDPVFSGLLNQIRAGENIQEAVEQINSSCRKKESKTQSPPSVVLSPTNRVADFRNAHALADLPGESKIYIGHFQGEFDAQSERLPSPAPLELKVGAQVMFTKNGKQWLNGTLGIVRGLLSDRVQVELLFDSAGEIVEVEAASWESIRYEWDKTKKVLRQETVGKYTQIPLMLAWATTIHKAQGKTLDALEIDFERGAFAAGQAYVALSRCRELKNITLTRPIRPEDVRCDPTISHFYAGLRWQSESASIKRYSK